jgi:predicted PurR-regulated permease PerM
MSTEEPSPGGKARRRMRWPRWTPWIVVALAVILLAGLVIEAATRIGNVVWPIFVPLLISGALAYVLDPVVVWCERLGLSRRRAILATLLGAVVLIAIFVGFVVPRLAVQFAESARRLPALVQTLLEQIQPTLGALRRVNESLYNAVNDRINSYVADPSQLTTPLLDWFRSGSGGFLGLTTSLFESILIPLFVYYILRDLPRLRQHVELMIPPRYRTTSHEVFDRVAAVGSNFIRGQLTVCAAMAVLDSIGFVALGVPMPIFLGVCAGFGHLIPYVGPIAAAFLTVSLTALDSPEWWRIVGVIGVIGGVQAIESILLTPWILGSRLELHPFWVLAGITIAGHLFGILGMILASPVIAIAKVLLTYAQHAYLHSSFYLGPVPVFVPPKRPPDPPPRDDFAEASQVAADESVSPVTGDRARS